MKASYDSNGDWYREDGMGSSILSAAAECDNGGGGGGGGTLLMTFFLRPSRIASGKRGMRKHRSSCKHIPRGELTPCGYTHMVEVQRLVIRRADLVHAPCRFSTRRNPWRPFGDGSGLGYREWGHSQFRRYGVFHRLAFLPCIGSSCITGNMRRLYKKHRSSVKPMKMVSAFYVCLELC